MRALGFVAVTATLLVVEAPVAAQAPVTTPPPYIVLPNYNGVPVGEIASLEAGAFLARANDSSSARFNPAGLSRAERTSISGSAGVFEFITVSPQDANHGGASFQQVPALVGFVVKKPLGQEGWAGGFSLSRVNAWYQALESEWTFSSAAANERVSYSGSSTFSGWVASVAAGHGGDGKLRYGGSVDLQLTSSDRSGSVSDQLHDPTGLNALLVKSEGSAWTTQLRMSLGVQYEVLPALRLGAVMRTPGLTFLKGGRYAQEGLFQIGSTTATVSFFDHEGHVQYKLPFELQFGAAYVGRRGQVEVDVSTFAGAGAYNAFESSHTQTITIDQGPTGPSSVQQRPFVPPVIDSRSVTNVAVGGQLNLFADGRLRLHGGYATDRSPVGPSDTLFTKVNMGVWFVGASFRTSVILGSAGIRYASGTSGELTLPGLPGGHEAHSKIHVSSVGLVYSVAVLF
jgi:hypothetical protein